MPLGHIPLGNSQMLVFNFFDFYPLFTEFNLIIMHEQNYIRVSKKLTDFQKCGLQLNIVSPPQHITKKHP